MDHFDLNPELLKYIEDHTSKEDEVLAELRRYTFLKVVHPRMISGPVQGKFLEMISKLIKPHRILEIGTYTGYSAICLGRGLAKQGKLITIEINDELKKVNTHFFRKSGLSSKIKSITGDALTVIPRLEDQFDIVFV
ncbi:MAG: O-methyltransferase, partial [Bacteroidota bacterium]